MATMAFLVIVDLEFTPYSVVIDDGPPAVTGMQTYAGEVQKILEAGCASQQFDFTRLDLKSPTTDFQFDCIFEMVEA